MGLLIGEQDIFEPYTGSKPLQKILRSNAVLQLAILLETNKNSLVSPVETLKNGTEVEYHALVPTIHQNQKIYCVFTNTKELIEMCNQKFHDVLEAQREFSSWLIEFIPSKPFRLLLSFGELHGHFEQLRETLEQIKSVTFLTGPSCLPMTGSQNYHLPLPVEASKASEHNLLSKSDSFWDETISNHSRYKAFTLNTRLRRGSKPKAEVPIFQDINTKEKSLILDHFGFGMCNSALQITYSAKNLAEARLLHDQLHILGPILQSLSNSTFAFQGRLIDWDSRYEIISQTTDDRKPSEKLDVRRYDPISHYISNDKRCFSAYNDLPYKLNKRFKKQLKSELEKYKSGLSRDQRLLNHFATLFVKEYLGIFKKRAVKNNTEDTLDFEMIQSSNWNDVRFKPPSNFNYTGWRVEFRPLDSPITSREKSAILFFTTLMTRIITDEKMKANFYMPTSKVHENYQRSRKRNSHFTEKFFFRTGINDGKLEKEIIEYSIEEILQGKGSFIGLKGLISTWIELNKKELSLKGENVVESIWEVFDFLLSRASNKTMNNSQLLREFVLNHKDYKHDSVITDSIATDLIHFILQIQKNDHHEKLFGGHLKKWMHQKLNGF